MNVETIAKGLGYAGLIPFGFCALVVLGGSGWGVTPDSARNAAVLYGAIIVAFMSGLQWAYAIVAPGLAASSAARRLLFASVIPPLCAWASVLVLSNQSAAVVVYTMLIAVFCVDAQLRAAPWFPDWLWRLRIHLTVVAVASLMLVAHA